MSGFHSLSSNGSPIKMEKHRFGNAKVFYDKDGRLYYQGQQQQQSPNDFDSRHHPKYSPTPAQSEPIPDVHEYRSYDPDRDRKRKYEYDNRSLDHGLGLHEFRQKGYEVVKDEKYDPYTGKPVYSLDRGRDRDYPSMDRDRDHYGAARDGGRRYSPEGMSPPRSPDEKRPLPAPPRNAHMDKNGWQRSFDRHPLVDDRYYASQSTSGKLRCVAVLYILVAIGILGLGIANILICGEYYYYFHYWVGALVLLTGIFTLVHTGDYSTLWKTWCLVIFANITVVAAFVGYTFLVRKLSPQTQAISLSGNLTMYAEMNKPMDPYVSIDSDDVTWACYAMDWVTFTLLLLTFSLMSLAMVTFSKYWEQNYTSTSTIGPFCQPAIFNPWGQAQLGQAMVFFGVIAVYTCTAEVNDTLWAKYWSPVWAGAVTIVAGWVSGLAGKRDDHTEAALGAVIFQIISLCASMAAIVLCTLGLVDNINTVQDIDDDNVMAGVMVRGLVITSAVCYALCDAVCLLNVFYTIGGMVRHLISFCTGIRSKRSEKKRDFRENETSQSGYPGKPLQYQDRRGTELRYGEYPTQDRAFNNGYHYRY